MRNGHTNKEYEHHRRQRTVKMIGCYLTAALSHIALYKGLVAVSHENWKQLAAYALIALFTQMVACGWLLFGIFDELKVMNETWECEVDVDEEEKVEEAK